MKKGDKIKLYRKKSKVFIAANLNRKSVPACAERLILLLKEYKVSVFMDISAKENFSESGVDFVMTVLLLRILYLLSAETERYCVRQKRLFVMTSLFLE